MTPERWQQIESIVDEALDLLPEVRPAYVAHVCQGDAELLTEVNKMLASCERAATFLSAPAAPPGDFIAALAEPPPPEQPMDGQRIGPYEIKRELGRGGMGAVYLAERADGVFNQRVAIKIIKKGMDSDDILARFRNERQILASMDHPGIAKLLDGGTTADGRPYFVMEYVKGIPIDEFCDRHRLSISDRLLLFHQVCEAVHYAHQNLIVHRDLKPGNILVTHEGVVKLLDFGVAKMLDPDLHGGSAYGQTQTGVRMMTPDYASPEQVLGQPITTASDIYSLGVILYELLTGHRPYQMQSYVLREIERIIIEEDPVRPSTAVATTRRFETENGQTATIGPQTVTSVRSVNLERLRRSLQGDVDNIVMMAMRKEPHRRYGSAEQLAEDLERHMDGLPIRAHQDTVGYRVQKFVQRNQLLVTATAMIFLALIGGFGMALWQARIASFERDIARQQALRAERTKDFLVNVFEIAEPSESKGREVTAEEILNRGAIRIGDELMGQPSLQAELREVIGTVYQKLGLYTSAEAQLAEALRLNRDLHGETSAEVARSLDALGAVLKDKGDYAAADTALQQALTVLRQRYGSVHERVAAGINNLAILHWDKGDYDRAETLFQESLQMKRQLYGEDHPEVVRSLNNLAVLRQRSGQYEAAEALYREALQIRRARYGDDHLEVALSMNNLGLLYREMERFDEGEQLFTDALRIRRATFGDEHQAVAAAQNNLASLYREQGNYAEAEALQREALGVFEKLFTHAHPNTALLRSNLAAILYEKGDREAAFAAYREALDIFEWKLPEAHPNIATAAIGLGRIALDRGDLEEAERQLRRGLDIRERRLGLGDRRTGEARSLLGESLARQRQDAEAEPLLVQGFETLREARGLDYSNTRDALQRLVAFYDARGRTADAEAYRNLTAE